VAGEGVGGSQVGFAVLIAWLREFRRGALKGEPSDRALAMAAKVSPTTFGKWLSGQRFPQQIDDLLVVVRMIHAYAVRTGPVESVMAEMLAEQRWREAYTAETARRAAAVGEVVQAAQAQQVLERLRPGRPLEQVRDPFALEVHRPIQLDTPHAQAELPVLPPYVPREHDQRLAAVVEAALDGHSAMAVLVAGSSAGKTRCLWEALEPLRQEGVMLGWETGVRPHRSASVSTSAPSGRASGSRPACPSTAPRPTGPGSRP